MVNSAVTDSDSLTFCVWCPGGPCLAEYSDGMYYRAKLMRFTSVEPVMVLIKHMDFGSDDTLPPSRYDPHTLQEHSFIQVSLYNW